MNVIIVLAIASALLQILGYLFYIRESLRDEIEPHPATWFMFAYGVLLLTILEGDQGASLFLLLLPSSCAILSIVVALLCWKRGTLKWPRHWQDRSAFFTDICLTFLYICAWALDSTGAISELDRELAVAVFLIASNMTTISSFYPLIRNTYLHPSHERAQPWIVWAFAYVTLMLATYIEVGPFSILMIYPGMNAFLHALVAYFARPSRRKRVV